MASVLWKGGERGGRGKRTYFRGVPTTGGEKKTKNKRARVMEKPVKTKIVRFAGRNPK